MLLFMVVVLLALTDLNIFDIVNGLIRFGFNNINQQTL